MTWEERHQWFRDRIGKRVFRNHHQCCEHCEEVYKNGLVIFDDMHATYLHDIEVEFTAEGNSTHYFDTRKEMLEYESKLNEEKEKKQRLRICKA